MILILLRGFCQNPRSFLLRSPLWAMWGITSNVILFRRQPVFPQNNGAVCNFDVNICFFGATTECRATSDNLFYMCQNLLKNEA